MLAQTVFMSMPSDALLPGDLVGLGADSVKVFETMQWLKQLESVTYYPILNPEGNEKNNN